MDCVVLGYSLLKEVCVQVDACSSSLCCRHQLYICGKVYEYGDMFVDMDRQVPRHKHIWAHQVSLEKVMKENTLESSYRLLGGEQGIAEERK